MTRRRRTVIAIATLFAFAGTASAQRVSIAVGTALPLLDLATVGGTGIDVDLQVRTEPIVGSLPLRIDLAYDHFGGKGVTGASTISAQSVSLMGDIGTMFYWMAGPGYYQRSATTVISGHKAGIQDQYFGAQAAVGVDFRVFRWDGFLEASVVRFFSPAPILSYAPLRFGIRL